jgi:hypothetical protein
MVTMGSRKECLLGERDQKSGLEMIPLKTRRRHFRQRGE